MQSATWRSTRVTGRTRRTSTLARTSIQCRLHRWSRPVSAGAHGRRPLRRLAACSEEPGATTRIQSVTSAWTSRWVVERKVRVVAPGSSEQAASRRQGRRPRAPEPHRCSRAPARRGRASRPSETCQHNRNPLAWNVKATPASLAGLCYQSLASRGRLNDAINRRERVQDHATDNTDNTARLLRGKTGPWPLVDRGFASVPADRLRPANRLPSACSATSAVKILLRPARPYTTPINRSPASAANASRNTSKARCGMWCTIHARRPPRPR